MDTMFNSTSEFITKVINQLNLGELRSGDTLSVQIPPECTSLPDLFAIGQLLAFIWELKDKHKINTEFIFAPPKRIESTLAKTESQVLHSIDNLGELGFIEFCRENGIHCEFPSDPQLLLPSIIDPAEKQMRRIEGSIYWRCLVPLKRHSFKRPEVVEESYIISIVSDFVNKFTYQVQSRMAEFEFDPLELGLELSRILFVLVRELLSNTITHSGEDEFLFAMTVSREMESECQPYKPGITLPLGQDKFEILVMDFGYGISRTVEMALNDGEAINDEYFSLSEWNDRRRLSKAKEESLLTNIFRGDLVIRKGRKSEGLYELGQTLSWFNGTLKLCTGRSELQVYAADGEELTTKLQHLRRPYYLPGVVASASLPSYQIKTMLLKRLAVKQINPTIPRNLDRRCSLCRFDRLPSGFFGGLSAIKPRRRSELEAELIMIEYLAERNKERVEYPTLPFFWNINLKMSNNIDVDFLDGFIQELCKKIDYVETDNSKNFYKLVFTNVPRNVINILKKRNCSSFLMLKETFCLFLDEADEPHFLGVPRVSNEIFDIEEALILIYYAGSVTVKKLLSPEIGMTIQSVDHLKRLAGNSNESIFSLRIIEGQEVFFSYDIGDALRYARYENAKSLKDMRLQEDNAVFKLRNDTYINFIYDFCLQWSDEDTLIDCTKLLLAQSKFPLVDTLVAFMNNGDRLAAALQRFTKTPNLIFADPHNFDHWKNLKIEGDCILVVDALYPGDDRNGYVKGFIERSKSNGKYRLKQLLAFHDFRECITTGQSEENEQHESKLTLSGLSIISVPVPDKTSIPKSIDPEKTANILQNYQNYILSKPSRSLSGNDIYLEFKPYKYSPTELSTEFWQNASALGIIDSKQTGRESRNVLFYENNEKLIQSPRMRRLVTKFVADYVKNVLDLKVDVILHPDHPVGSFLAQQVAAQLNIKPLILPLTQRMYGGQIELTSNDYIYCRSLIENYQRKHGREKLKSLIVDDSVLSGGSLFTMLGVAARLGLENNGILVLLSRLKPEISNALSTFQRNFSYLYRLHMPILTQDQSPDRKLRELNEDEEFVANSRSYFAQLWASKLKSEGSHFRPHNENIRIANPPSVNPKFLKNIKGASMETYQLEQIIQHLILHPDPYILGFYIRVAITYNFLEQLLQEKAFWNLLEGLFESDDAIRPESQSILLLRKILYILAFSNYTHPLDIYKSYQRLCCNFIDQCFRKETWLQHKDLVTDCLMWLGVIGSEKLLSIGSVTLGTVLDYTFEDFSAVDTSRELSREHAEPKDITLRQTAAADILGAFAWGLHVYIHLKGFTMLDNESVFSLLEELKQKKLSGEKNLLLIDILEPLISVSPELGGELGIDAWPIMDDFYSGLKSDDFNNDMMWYLKEAPGYTCTLKTLLRICKADTVLMYAKNKSDKEFFLRVFDTSQGKRADDDLVAEHFTESHLPKEIRQRMKESLFFSSIRPDHASTLNRFSKGAEHLWCMGGAVNIETMEMRYYVIFGYWKRKPDHNFQSTAYFYWLKCEVLLQQILPRIHSKYVESATEWNAKIQSIRPVHPIKYDDPVRSDLVNNRRKIISYAMTNADIGDLLRRAVRMYTEPVYRLVAIRNEIRIICKNIRLYIASIVKEDRNRELAESAQLRMDELPAFVPQADALTSEQENMFCSLHMALLKFVAYECLYNALAYFHKHIDVKIEFISKRDSNYLTILLRIANDIHPEAVGDSRPKTPIGITACEIATSAVNGYFEAGMDEKSGLWIATTKLRAHKVPDELRRELNGLLK